MRTRHHWRVAAAIAVLAVIAGGCGEEDASATKPDKERFCELEKELGASQPDIDFEKASPDEVRQALSKFISENRDKIRESAKVAPDDIRTDLVKAQKLIRDTARTGVPKFEDPAPMHVGEYLAQACGLEGP